MLQVISQSIKVGRSRQAGIRVMEDEQHGVPQQLLLRTQDTHVVICPQQHPPPTDQPNLINQPRGRTRSANRNRQTKTALKKPQLKLKNAQVGMDGTFGLSVSEEEKHKQFVGGCG
jgi:hypothetical protein